MFVFDHALDAVFFAGDFVDEPTRASEWFDRFDPKIADYALESKMMVR